MVYRMTISIQIQYKKASSIYRPPTVIPSPTQQEQPFPLRFRKVAPSYRQHACDTARDPLCWHTDAHKQTTTNTSSHICAIQVGFESQTHNTSRTCYLFAGCEISNNRSVTIWLFCIIASFQVKFSHLFAFGPWSTVAKAPFIQSLIFSRSQLCGGCPQKSNNILIDSWDGFCVLYMGALIFKGFQKYSNTINQEQSSFIENLSVCLFSGYKMILKDKHY